MVRSTRLFTSFEKLKNVYCENFDSIEVRAGIIYALVKVYLPNDAGESEKFLFATIQENFARASHLHDKIKAENLPEKAFEESSRAKITHWECEKMANANMTKQAILRLIDIYTSHRINAYPSQVKMEIDDLAHQLVVLLASMDYTVLLDGLYKDPLKQKVEDFLYAYRRHNSPSHIWIQACIHSQAFVLFYEHSHEENLELWQKIIHMTAVYLKKNIRRNPTDPQNIPATINGRNIYAYHTAAAEKFLIVTQYRQGNFDAILAEL